jgi:hypothetical protein
MSSCRLSQRSADGRVRPRRGNLYLPKTTSEALTTARVNEVRSIIERPAVVESVPCLRCGTKFLSPVHSPKKYCSAECRRPPENRMECPICGKSFYHYPAQKRVTCSRYCAKARKQKEKE